MAGAVRREMTDLKSFIPIAAERALTDSEAIEAFSALIDGQATPVQAGGFLMALRTRGETTAEYAAAARVMRERATAVDAPDHAIDIVGTGGDGKGTLNISTAAAIVVAGCGVPVAKHGNRNLSSRSGAADVLEALGVNPAVSADTVTASIAAGGLGFMMAPVFHPAMRNVMPVRQELGTRTIFNILGPLINPARVRSQLSGAFSEALIRPMAETLRMLGSEYAWVVHGADGTDEMSICGPTSVAALDRGTITVMTVHPADAGLPTHPFDSIAGGEPSDNAAALSALLDGQPSAYRDAVLLNAAAAMVACRDVPDLQVAAQRAAQSIDSGAALAALRTLARITSGAD